jgi:hypothetical protein
MNIERSFSDLNGGKGDNEKGPKDPGRRKFLKTLGVGALTFVGGSLVRKLGDDKKTGEITTEKEKGNNETVRSKTPDKEELIKSDPELRISEDEYYENENIKEVKKALNYKSPGRIVIDEKNSLRTQDYWEEKHRNDPKFSESLEKGMIEIEPYLKDLRLIFDEESRIASERGYLWDYREEKIIKECKVPKDFKLPQEYIFLSVAESYWNPKAKSPKGALGAFQLMKKTAINNGLRVDDQVDQRLDPYLSARACARNLIELYIRTKKDWNLALAGYNGSYIWNYLKYCGQKSTKPDYKGFLRSLSFKINERRDLIRNKKNKNYLHEVTEKQKLDDIEKIYKISKKLIIKSNKLGNEKLKKGQKLKIPLVNDGIREICFDREMNGYAENLVYPPKFYAILKLIREKRSEWFNKELLYAKNNNLNKEK